MMSTNKQKFLQEGGDVNLVHENEKPKVGKEYAERLSDTLHVPVNYDDGEGNHVAVPSGESYFSPNPMKGIKWDGSAIATKGMTRSDWRSMFSVGNLVAFESSGYCSPDGRQSARGANLLTADYKLQDEIDLKEYDNTSVNGYGSGSYDIQQQITLNPVFLHEENRNGTAYYLTGIFKDNEPRLDEKLCKGVRIEEIRNNPGLYLHVYSVGSFEASIAQNEHNIEDAISKIKNAATNTENLMDELKLKAQENREKLGANFTKEGIEYAKLVAKRAYGDDSYWSDSLKNSKLSGFDKLLENIAALNKGEAFAMMYKSSYYSKPSNHQIASDLDIGVPSLGTDDHFGSAVRDQNILVYKIAKKTKTKNGLYCGSFSAGGVVDVFQDNDGSLTYRTNRYESRANSQSWNEQVSYDITRYEIETGEEGLMKEYNDKYQEIKEKNKSKFDESASKVESLYGKDILNLTKQHKGKILAILENLANDDLSKRLSDKKDLLKEALQISVNSYRDTVLTLISLIAYNPSSVQIKKVFGAEFDFSTSRAHYANILGGVPTYGKMDSVSEAYSIYYTKFKDYADTSKKRFDKKFLEKDFKSKGFDSAGEYNEYLNKTNKNGTYVN